MSNNRWMPRAILQRAAQVLQEDGWRSLWFKVWGEVAYRRAALFVRDIADVPLQASAAQPVETGILTAAELNDYLALRPDATAAEVQRRWVAGQQCFIVRHQGRLVHVCWAAFGYARIDYLSREIQLAPDDVYSYESFTVPDFRGYNAAAARGAYMQSILGRAGVRRLVAVAVPDNKPAVRAIEKAGYVRAGTLRTIWLGRWRWHWGRVPARSISAAYWDTIAQQSQARPHYLDPFLGQLKRQAHLDLIERWGGLPSTGRVLKTDLFEEALGPDAFLWEMAGDERVIVGMDISPALAAEARGNDRARVGRYLAADVRCLPFANHSFNFIISPSTLDHFSDPADLNRSLRELRRVLAADGQLIVTVDNRQNVFDPLLRLAHRLGFVPYFMGRSYSIGELVAELEAAGFVVTATTAILHNPRLIATALVAIANRLRWPPLTRQVQRCLIAAQHLTGSRWQYRTGSFVAARARPRVAA
ncbi:MAG: methyltransferase domain-containing protein [Chloroflexi bacterium]|nr:methyltransferase domain-containing protein [Chloroflexota bacterium]